MPHRLSKSRYTAGVQCHKLLWWKVHEPNALQLQPDKVLQESGVRITGVDVMHLNRECHFPDLDNLFQRTDVTAAVEPLLNKVGWEIDAQLEMLAGSLPDVAIGLHCHEPYECPFMARCWPQDRDHIMNLSGVGPKKGCAFLLTGVHRIADLPAQQKLNVTQKRQIRAMRENRLIVEPGLEQALEAFHGRIGFLDFETIQRAVPVWPGMGPWEQAPAQFSYHELQDDGSYAHDEFLAEGPKDCRPALVRHMLEATKHADTIATYSHFERTKIRALQKAVPELQPELEALEHKLIDLLPVVRENVYHPDFLGSFSLKYVLHPLVPELTYDDLVIVDGLVASVEIARLLFVAGEIPKDEHDRVRQDLLNYCERDTWAMVKVLEKLRELSVG